jgi:Glycosyl transferase family 2
MDTPQSGNGATMACRLSICMLTRDEAHSLPQALASLKGLADELIIADTGSIDGTLKIAREHGATLIKHTWEESFSAGRNAALDAVTGDWILWLNADEEIPAESHPRIRELINAEASARVFGYRVRLRTIPRAERPDQFIDEVDLRLFRKAPGLHYEGRLHPGFPQPMAEQLMKDGWRVETSDVVFLHHASLSTPTPAKLRWSARLIEKELDDKPDNLHVLIEHAQTLLALRDPRGHDVMARAAGLLPAPETPEATGPDAARVLEYVLRTDPELKKTTMTVEQASGLALRWYPNSPPLLWAFAERLFRSGQFAPAAGLLDRLLYLGDTKTYDPSSAFDPRIVGPWVLLNLGQCRRALGQTDVAAHYFQRLRNDPEFQAQADTLLKALRQDASR